MPNSLRSRSFGQITVYAFVLLFLLWTLIPLVWMLLASLRTQTSMFTMPPRVFIAPDFSAYQFMFFGGGGFGRYLVNSLIAAIVSSVIALGLGSLGGYALARVNWRFKSDISFWIISTRMAPIAVVIVPLYLMFRQLHLLDSLLGLIVAYCTFNLPFAIWLMQAFFSDVPREIEESARIDGCSTFGLFWRISLPLVTPGIVATGVLCLVFAWNDFAFATTFSGHDTQTIPVAASQLITQQGVLWGQLMATGIVILLPMLVVGIAIRRWLVRGLTMGAMGGQ